MAEEKYTYYTLMMLCEADNLPDDAVLALSFCEDAKNSLVATGKESSDATTGCSMLYDGASFRRLYEKMLVKLEPLLKALWEVAKRSKSKSTVVFISLPLTSDFQEKKSAGYSRTFSIYVTPGILHKKRLKYYLSALKNIIPKGAVVSVPGMNLKVLGWVPVEAESLVALTQNLSFVRIQIERGKADVKFNSGKEKYEDFKEIGL